MVIDALQALELQYPAKQGNVEVRELDLSSLQSVRSFTQQFNEQRRRLDILVCNAGIMAPPDRALTPDGLEQQFQVTCPTGLPRVIYRPVVQHYRRTAHALLPTDTLANSPAGELPVALASGP